MIGAEPVFAALGLIAIVAFLWYGYEPSTRKLLRRERVVAITELDEDDQVLRRHEDPRLLAEYRSQLTRSKSSTFSHKLLPAPSMTGSDTTLVIACHGNGWTGIRAATCYSMAAVTTRNRSRLSSASRSTSGGHSGRTDGPMDCRTTT